MIDLKAVFGVIFLVIGLYHFWDNRELEQPPGILVPEQPEQGPKITYEIGPIKFKDVVLDPLATYSIRARVISTERYWIDPVSNLAPIDVALAWGPASDTNFLEGFKFSQSGRFYFYAWDGEVDERSKILALNSANVHIIPANKYILEQVKKLRSGQVIHLTGYLVRVNKVDGTEWVSSLTRNDSGNGACEIMYVQNIKFY
jgi:hypothetical protein